jgi:N-acylglucosamine 2-epimerase
MMTAYLTYELEGIIETEKRRDVFEYCVRQILEVHYNPKTGIIHEYVDSDGQFIDTYEGRLINPGHGIEAMWFLMDIAQKLEKPAIIEKAARICIEILEYSWDKEYGGIFYFMDAKNAPPQQLEWDQKLWWVHQEALIALSKAYLHTASKDIWAWFERVHQYTWQHFPDPENGEWFAYLNRAGKPHLSLKGGKWKGCFHTPRALYECWQNFEKLTKQNQE